MYKYKNDIFDLCSGAEQNALEYFCKEINNSNADVFVVMAHKAVQLFQILLEQNHIVDSVANKIIISNQALDFNCSYLFGKRIAIVDDIIISGTAISNTVNKLIHIGIPQQNISIITLAVDKHYMAMNFEGSDGQSVLHCNVELDDASCIDLSYNISRIFAYYGLPYDVDFPTYNAVDLSNKKFNSFYNNFLWRIERISTDKQIDEGVETFSIFPNEVVREELWNYIGVNLENSVHIKIRAYVINYPSGRKECNMIPMCLFNEISEHDLNTLFDLCKPTNREISPNQDNIFVAKMRYLQFYIAHHLYLLFLKCKSIKGLWKPLEISTRLLFGMIDGEKIYNSINSFSQSGSVEINIDTIDCIDKSLFDEYYNNKNCKDSLNDFKKYKCLEKEKQQYLINRIIFSPFLWWYDTKEIPVRNILKKQPRHYVKDYKDIECLSGRLKSGFSLQSIKMILNDILSDYESDIVISLFFDRAIDEGIVVPTIYHNTKNKYLCRAYRHGEDLPFGIEDECRLLFFLKKINEFIPNIEYSVFNENTQGISEISFEKIIVLFYQMGLKKGNVFNRFLGFNNIKLLKPFLSLHGKIEGIVDPTDIDRVHIYSEKGDDNNRYIIWITTWLLEKNFINKSGTSTQNDHMCYIKKDNIEKYLQENERNCISESIKNEIINFANMISTWYKFMLQSGNKKKFKEDAIALTSCSDAFVFASAIATEIHYFSNFWNNQVQKAFIRYNEIGEIYQLLTDDYYDKQQTSNTVQGLNSGRNKVVWYNNGRAATVVDDVAKILATRGANNWYEIWSSVKSSASSPLSSEVSDIEMYTAQAIGYLYFYSACYDCLIFDNYWKCGEKPPKFAEYKTLYMAQCEKTALLNKELFSVFDKVGKRRELCEKKSLFNKLVKNEIINSEDSVMNIEDNVTRNAIIYTVRYKASLIFEISAFEPSKINNVFMRIWGQLKDEVKTQMNIIQFPLYPSNGNIVKYGVFFGLSSNKNTISPLYCGKVLIDFYKKLCKAFNAKAYEIKAILLPDTPPGRMFEHNIQKNIIENAEKFKIKIINKLDKNYKIGTNQQLILVMTDYVDTCFYDVVNTMRWDHCQKLKIQDVESPFSSIKIYYNDYVKITDTKKEVKNVTYSVVRIKCGDNCGAGLLLRTSKQVVCISCNHIFQPYFQNEKIMAISEYSSEKSFLIKPLMKVIKCDYDNKVLPASNEITILSPCWNGRIPFDISRILSVDDLNITIEDYLGKNCICCGYPRGGTQQWSDAIKLINRSSKDYYQTRIIDQANEKENMDFQGYSGGIIVPEDNQNCVIGIHEGRFQEKKGRVIPCSVIKEKLRGI